MRITFSIQGNVLWTPGNGHIYVFVSRVYQGYAKYAKTRTFFPIVERKIRGNCSLYCLRYAVHVHHFITDPPIPTPRNYTTICLGLWSAESGIFLVRLEVDWAQVTTAHVFADGRWTVSHKRKMKLLEAPTGTLIFFTKTLNKRLCTRNCWRNVVCRRSEWSAWTRDKTQIQLRLQQEKVDIRLRIVTVPEV